MTELPERINVMKIVTYDVQRIVEQILEDRASGDTYDRTGVRTIADDSPITIEDIMERVESYIEEDFWGIKPKHLIIQDEQGNEL